jgi:hypothetical protein
VELDYAYRFDNLGKAAAFFNTYHCIAFIIILSLLTGLIWEIYIFVNKNLEEEANVKEALSTIRESLKKAHSEGSTSNMSNDRPTIEILKDEKSPKVDQEEFKTADPAFHVTRAKPFEVGNNRREEIESNVILEQTSNEEQKSLLHPTTPPRVSKTNHFNTQLLLNSAKIEPEAPLNQHQGDNEKIELNEIGSIKLVHQSGSLRKRLDPEDDPDYTLTLGFEKDMKSRTYILERELYVKKIKIYHPPIMNRNQLECAMDNSVGSKTIETEPVLLRLQDEDDHQAEKIENEMLTGVDFDTALALSGIYRLDEERYNHLYREVCENIETKDKKFSQCNAYSLAF